MGVTLDGFVHGAQGYEDWGLPPEEDDVVAWKVASLREAGTHIMGRATYEAMASVWPTTTGVYADVMNEIPKVVFSRTLTRADWPESQIASGELAADIDRLKREPGGVIVAHGGATRHRRVDPPHGLRLEWLVEHDWTVWPRFAWLVKDEHGRWSPPPSVPRAPLSFSLLAARHN